MHQSSCSELTALRNKNTNRAYHAPFAGVRLAAWDWRMVCSWFRDGALNNAGRPRRWGKKAADPWPWASAERHQSEEIVKWVEIQILSLFTHPHVITNLYEFLSSSENKRNYFEERWQPKSWQYPLTFTVWKNTS